MAGLMVTGMAGILLQVASLWASITPALLDDWGWRFSAEAVTYAVVLGLVASRFGLWLFDLAVNQMLQEWVADADMGALGCACVKQAMHKGVWCAGYKRTCCCDGNGMATSYGNGNGMQRWLCVVERARAFSGPRLCLAKG
jgi:Ferroportin1 (FPN1)